ncbi:MAG: CofH family radical SAM protein [Synechococcaceae bacterium WB8_1B_136]|nr:CofH family radical SAM protein [Synechococcaceae bacterium WB8_1B_136]
MARSSPSPEQRSAVTERPQALAAWSWCEAGELLVRLPAASSRELDIGPDPSPESPGTWGAEQQQRLQQALARDPASGEALALAHQLLCTPASPALQASADQLRAQLAGDTVTYVVNRNLNFTNLCLQHCGFCAFRRDPGEPGAFWHSFELLQQRAAEARQRGGTELCIQGGLNPEARLQGSALRYYAALLTALAEAAPGLHLHGFSPQELLFIAQQDGLPLQTVITELQQAGLGSVPGTAAEVLSERVRRRLCPEKLSARAWCAVIREVHAAGLSSTATLMAGHLEQPADRALHLLTLVALQQRAWQHQQNGFSEFVLLPYIGASAPAPLRQRVGRDQPDPVAMLALTAQARLLLGHWFINHQPSWVKLGLAGATEALRWGCNDLGGTLMEESITSMAGAQGGTCQSVEALEQAARSLGRPVRRRTTLYGEVAA